MRNANYARIVVAALAAFVASSAWYTVFGGAMTELRGAAPTTPASTGSLAGTMLFVVAQSLVVALMISYFVSRLGIADRKAALRLGALIWFFPASILLGSVVHENVPLALAAIHAGDWLAKLLPMAAILGARPADRRVGHRSSRGKWQGRLVDAVRRRAGVEGR